ncbi:unnamed protein product [Effrenium voratum]|nr:unnamed protein product [Effrenium voratum]
MPRPGDQKLLTEEQQWFVTLLDRKFEQQEALLRELLGSRRDLPEFPSNGGHSIPAKLEEKAIDGAAVASSATEEIKIGARRSASAKKLGSAQVMIETMQPDPPIKTFVKGHLDGYMGLVVVINLILMAAMAQTGGHAADASLGLATGSTAELVDAFEVAELVFFCLYVIDVVARICILRKEWYYDRLEGWMYMNMFDLVLALVHAFEILMLPALISGNSDQRASTIRVIKLMRIVRTLRIVKTVSLFRQLRLLVSTCVASIGALFWSMVLLFMLKVGFALVVCQALQGYIMDQSGDLDTRLEVNALYGSFSKSLYTTFEITHSGSWPSKVRPVIDKVSAWYAVPFLGYITLVVFAVIRIVTALFLKETLASAANDADMQIDEQRAMARDYRNKLEELFKAADTDGSDSLSASEFVTALSLPSVQRYLQVLEVKIQDCEPLFDILDDGDGRITIHEFCKGIMKIKGQARALDIVLLQRESHKVLKECQEIHQQLSQLSSLR